jgi:hypothetical protein
MVAGSPTIPLSRGHEYSTVKGSSICYYFRIGARKMNVDERKIREIEYRFLPCRCSECIKDEKDGIGTHASMESPGAFGSTCKNKSNMGIRHYTDMGKWVKLPMTLRLEALERRRRENAAWVSGVSRRAIATAARLAAEEDVDY